MQKRNVQISVLSLRLIILQAVGIVRMDFFRYCRLAVCSGLSEKASGSEKE